MKKVDSQEMEELDLDRKKNGNETPSDERTLVSLGQKDTAEAPPTEARELPKEISDEAPHIWDIEGLDETNIVKVKEILIKKVIEGKKPLPGEVDKTPELNNMVSFVDAAADNILRKYSKKKLYKPKSESIHFIPAEARLLSTREKEAGIWKPEEGSITVEHNGDEDALNTAVWLFHEMVHAKSFNSLSFSPKEQTEDYEINPKRTGIGSYTAEERMWLRHFNEALVQKMTIRFYEEYAKNSNFFSQKQRDKFAETESDFDMTYMEARVRLDQLTRAIYKASNGQFQNSEEVEDFFIKASLSGDASKIKKLVDETLGEKSYETLGKAESFYNGGFSSLVK